MGRNRWNKKFALNKWQAEQPDLPPKLLIYLYDPIPRSQNLFTAFGSSALDSAASAAGDAADAAAGAAEESVAGGS